ncbi:MAG: iron-sulfur cluster assembly scaffold protein [Deltaproteobacteria bacterium]|nr:iron-sulfur cluster assembly scaffold protein [Deltaproteobacteria bacterium]
MSLEKQSISETPEESLRDLEHLSENFLSHANFPRNVGAVTQPNGVAIGIGVCGDSVEVSLLVRHNRVMDVKCRPEGCVYTVTCASALSELIKGHTLEQALELSPEDVDQELGGLPEDHMHCARLAVNTLGEAIDDYYLKSREENKA